MDDSPFFHRLAAGQTGAWTTPLRGLLRCGEIAYASAMRLRNRRFDRESSVVRATVPVISVGNMTVGGTGKTPIVIDLAGRLDRMGRSPAVVARGYGAADGESNDEERLIRRRCPGAIYVADPDRAEASRRAVDRLGADVVVLDDGFQHRRLARDLDIVLIDAMCPFGYGHVLPRGLLREPLEGLRRADLFVITRSDQVSTNELAAIESCLRQLSDDVPILRCRHRVTGIERLDGGRAELHLDGRRVVLFAAIGRPAAFATTVAMLGAEIVATRWWPDHHRYRLRDLQSLFAEVRSIPHDLVLTTEKDAVKLDELRGFDQSAVAVVRVAVEWLGDGDATLQRMLENALRRGKGN